ncbi:hypothetical protein PR048_004882 [Dryococelus australis]|uniref:Ig-like domain-containing protein n=1 Tax=Dryococelus australis TaxID=614101 RepID=A0ABQ9I6P0_9NEOP|nr:hypothetical protein PR048_004882 [Dryococelus australis]
METQYETGMPEMKHPHNDRDLPLETGIEPELGGCGSSQGRVAAGDAEWGGEDSLEEEAAATAAASLLNDTAAEAAVLRTVTVRLHAEAQLECEVSGGERPSSPRPWFEAAWRHGGQHVDAVKVSGSTLGGAQGHRLSRDPITGQLNIASARLDDDGLWQCEERDPVSARVVAAGLPVRLVVLAISTLASHQGEPSSIPGRVTDFSLVGIALDSAVGWRVYSGISHFLRLPPFRARFSVGSERTSFRYPRVNPSGEKVAVVTRTESNRREIVVGGAGLRNACTYCFVDLRTISLSYALSQELVTNVAAMYTVEYAAHQADAEDELDRHQPPNQNRDPALNTMFFHSFHHVFLSQHRPEAGFAILSQSHQKILASSLNVSETLAGERRSVLSESLAAVGIHGIPKRGQGNHKRIVAGRGRARWVSDYGARQRSWCQLQHVTLPSP